MTVLSLSPSSSSDPSSTGAFYIYLEYLDAKKMMDKVEYRYGHGHIDTDGCGCEEPIMIMKVKFTM